MYKVSDHVRGVVKLDMFPGASVVIETDGDILRVPGDVDDLYRKRPKREKLAPLISLVQLEAF